MVVNVIQIFTNMLYSILHFLEFIFFSYKWKDTFENAKDKCLIYSRPLKYYYNIMAFSLSSHVP